MAPAGHLPRGRCLHLRARRRRAGARRRAGRRRGDRHGRGRRDGEGLRVLRTRAPRRNRGRDRRTASRSRRPGSASRSSFSANSSARRDRKRRSPSRCSSTTARTFTKPSPPSGPIALQAANAITTKAERDAALDEATDAIAAELAPDYPEREREIRSAVRVATRRRSSASGSSKKASASTGGARPTSGRSQPRSACSRPLTDRPSSSVATPRCSTSAR